ncbi:hypothetical protein CHLRE_01g009676v5 [Chlamydomonas reinhardtii]|uniref:Uncharacterized protein n=1 Tax=Chlamydomonas reinhardtii TaxID=3055 RepID=A0A2K3E5G2_CHLRE|nr:uncharacterized protein CHLRE_01g009676v5 [Chlamydomonas reinhardtii]PNW87987.1 hypothetical protein CHLRE_01g009676v5 [Chlamydomonas reinhardtii]
MLITRFLRWSVTSVAAMQNARRLQSIGVPHIILSTVRFVMRFACRNHSSGRKHGLMQ